MSMTTHFSLNGAVFYMNKLANTQSISIINSTLIKIGFREDGYS